MITPLKKRGCLATEPQRVRRQWREYQAQNCASGAGKVRGQGGPTTVLPRLTILLPFGSGGVGFQPIALDATHVGHGSRGDNQTGHAEQAAHGQLAGWEGVLDRADGGPPVSPYPVF